MAAAERFEAGAALSLSPGVWTSSRDLRREAWRAARLVTHSTAFVMVHPAEDGMHLVRQGLFV
jgi:hypothetical protein